MSWGVWGSGLIIVLMISLALFIRACMILERQALLSAGIDPDAPRDDPQDDVPARPDVREPFDSRPPLPRR